MSCGTGQLPLLGEPCTGFGVGGHKFEVAGLVKNQSNPDFSAWQLRWAPMWCEAVEVMDSIDSMLSSGGVCVQSFLELLVYF